MKTDNRVSGDEIAEESSVARGGDRLRPQIFISVFLGLLILTVFVLPSLGAGVVYERWYGNIVFSALAVVGVAIAWDHPRLLRVAIPVGVAGTFARWFAFFHPDRSSQFLSEGASLAIILMISWILLVQIFGRAKSITKVSIQAAIAIYLLFGFGWANAYQIAIQVNPHAFQSTVELSSTSVEEWFYYSFVTLTTLGYGDITPLSRVARSLAIGEALTGQLYLAVLIARLIGLEMLSHQVEKKSET